MTDLVDQVRAEFADTTGSGRPSADLADRALAAGLRRRLGRRLAVGSAAVAVAVSVTLAAAQVLAPQAPDPRPAGADARNAVYATQDRNETWKVLDPATGRYRTMRAEYLTEPTTDLRYAAVGRPRVGDDGSPLDFPTKQIGRYEATTGNIRWYDTPMPTGLGRISPDGRHIAVTEHGAAGEVVDKLMIVDTRSGAVEVLTMTPDILASAKVRFAGARGPDLVRGVLWRPDSRSFLVGSAVVDLTGHRVAEVAMPGDAWLVAARPAGDGLLIVPNDAPDSFAVTDAAGRSGTPFRVTWPTCLARPATERWNPALCPTTRGEGFLGWRGEGHILVPSEPDWRNTIDAVDVRTGERTVVARFDGEWVVVVPADTLPPQVRDAVAF